MVTHVISGICTIPKGTYGDMNVTWCIVKECVCQSIQVRITTQFWDTVFLATGSDRVGWQTYTSERQEVVPGDNGDAMSPDTVLLGYYKLPPSLGTRLSTGGPVLPEYKAIHLPKMLKFLQGQYFVEDWKKKINFRSADQLVKCTKMYPLSKWKFQSIPYRAHSTVPIGNKQFLIIFLHYSGDDYRIYSNRADDPI